MFYMLMEVLPDRILSTPPKVANTATGQRSSLLCVNCPIVGAQNCTLLLDTSVVAHNNYVITYDLVNLTIFCYDYKLGLSTVITF